MTENIFEGPLTIVALKFALCEYPRYATALTNESERTAEGSEMNVRGIVVSTARNGYRNLVGTLAVSLLVSLSFVPFLGMLLLRSPLAVLAGLWATCLSLGIVLVGGFRFATSVAERGVPIPVLPKLRATLAEPRAGLALGALTFVVVVVAGTLPLVAPPSLTPFATGIAAFLFADWYLVVGFAVPEIAAGDSLRSALRAGAVRLLEAPTAVAVFLILSFACALVAGVTVVTVALFLPGVLCLLAAHVTDAVEAERSTE